MGTLSFFTVCVSENRMEMVVALLGHAGSSFCREMTQCQWPNESLVGRSAPREGWFYYRP